MNNNYQYPGFFWNNYGGIIFITVIDYLLLLSTLVSTPIENNVPHARKKKGDPELTISEQ